MVIVAIDNYCWGIYPSVVAAVVEIQQKLAEAVGETPSFLIGEGTLSFQFPGLDEYHFRVTDVINLSPHAIVVAGETIEPSGQIARVSAGYTDAGNIAGIPVYSQQYGDVEGLPDPQQDTIYIVSAIVLSALAGSRSDVYAPATGHPDVVRNEQGHIVSVPGFVK